MTKSEENKTADKRDQELTQLAKENEKWPAGRNPTFVGQFGVYEYSEWVSRRNLIDPKAQLRTKA